MFNIKNLMFEIAFSRNQKPVISNYFLILNSQPSIRLVFARCAALPDLNNGLGLGLGLGLGPGLETSIP
jgi:hypothetical protein